MDLEALSEVAKRAALAAGKVIRQHVNNDIVVEQKAGGTSRASQVVTAVDRAAESAIFSHILPTCQTNSIALLSEETEDDGSRLVQDYFWCIDPLDGTLAFIKQYPGFSVSVALVARDGTPQIGVVYDPSTDTLYHAIKGQGAFRNQQPWSVAATNQHLTYVTDRSLADTPRAAEIEAFLRQKVKQLKVNGTQELNGTGAVLGAIRVLENDPACMLKFPKTERGGGSVWDYAATACIYRELGLRATNFAGGPLNLNPAGDTFMHREGVFFANW
ncbi:MAG: inositol monophosphatase family protein [Bacteroidota bacterium]